MSNGGTSFDARIVLRPRSLDETYDLAIAYLRTNLRDFRKIYIGGTLLLSALIIVPSFLLDIPFGWQAAATFCVVPMFERVVTVFAGRHLFSNPASIFDSMKVVLRRLPFLVFHTGLVVLPALMIALDDWEEPSIGIFGIMLAFVWAFAVPSHFHLTEVILLEQLPLGRAMKRARGLLAFRFGRGLGSLFFMCAIRALIVATIYFGLSFVLGFVLQFEAVVENIGHYFAIVGYVATAPYAALARLFDYVDARTRREGWDIQVRFNAIAQRHARKEADRLAA